MKCGVPLTVLSAVFCCSCPPCWASGGRIVAMSRKLRGCGWEKPKSGQVACNAADPRHVAGLSRLYNYGVAKGTACGRASPHSCKAPMLADHSSGSHVRHPNDLQSRAGGAFPNEARCGALTCSSGMNNDGLHGRTVSLKQGPLQLNRQPVTSLFDGWW